MKYEAQQLRIGILAGIADLYNRSWPETQERLNQFIEEVVERFDVQGFKVFSNPAVSTPEDVQAVCQTYSESNVDLLVVTLALYCPSGAMIDTLKKTELPLLLWPVQTMYTLDPKTCGDDLITYNHGVHAVQDLANVLVREGKGFGVIHGQLDDNGFAEQMRTWAQAGRVISAMRRSNPVQIGGHFEDMLDLQIGQKAFLEQFDVKPVYVSLDEFSDYLNMVDGAAIESYVQSYQKEFSISDEVDSSLLEKTARGHFALDRILEEYDSFACGLNFLNLCNDERISDALHVGASVFMSRGGGYGGEGDWVTAMAVRGFQSALGAVSFSEIFSVGYGNQCLLVKHWGEGHLKMARNRPVLKRSSLNDHHLSEFIICDFEFEPGPVSLINLNCDIRGAGQLISIEGYLTEDHLPLVSGPRALFQPGSGDVRDVLDRYAYHGGSHHLVLAPGSCTKILERLGILTGWSNFYL